MSVLCKNKNIENLKEKLHYFDKATFGKGLPVIIRAGSDFSPACYFLKEDWFSKILSLGFIRDKYIIFSRSKELREIAKDPNGFVLAVVRVVRLRKQTKSRTALLSPFFAKRNALLPKGLVGQLRSTMCTKYSGKQQLQEFDVAVIQYQAMKALQDPSVSTEVLGAIIGCTRETVKKCF